MSELTIDPMTEDDLDALCDLQNSAHERGSLERREVWRDKLHHAPQGCWIARGAGHVAGYLVSHPWQRGIIPALDERLEVVTRVDCWHVHDLAIHPRFQGQGVGGELAAVAMSLAQENSLDSATLVAVRGAETFWRRVGFRQVEVLESGALNALRGYGVGAAYMVARPGRCQ